MSTEDFVGRALRSLGLDVQPIPVGATKTPDFRVSDGTQTYLLEVKNKFADSDLIRRREKALDSGGVWEEEVRLACQNVNREFCVDRVQLAAFLRATTPSPKPSATLRSRCWIAS